MKAYSLGKLLMSGAIIIFAFIPPLADLATDTHVFHPDWPAHARVHTVWLLGVTTSVGVLALYLLWSEDSNINLAGLLATCVYGGFFISVITAPLYEGALTDETGGIEQTVMGVDLNLFVFSLATLALVSGWLLCLKFSQSKT